MSAELKLVLERFIERDKNAVNELRETGCAHLLEARLSFVEGRLADVSSIACMILKHLTKEQP